MKKTAVFLTVVFLLLVFLAGCSVKEPVPLEYEGEILIATETPSLVWAGVFQTPVTGTSVLSASFPEWRLFGIVGQGKIEQISHLSASEYTQDHIGEEIHKLLEMSKEEQSRLFVVSLSDCTYASEDAPYYDSLDENGDPAYNGSSLLSLMLDADTYEILYAERFSSTNYNLGSRITPYVRGEDGRLYKPYAKD